MTESLEELEEKLKEIRDRLTVIQKEWEELKVMEAEIMERIKLAQKNHVKVVCPFCNGKGFLKTTLGEKICPHCSGKQYIVARLWSE